MCLPVLPATCRGSNVTAPYGFNIFVLLRFSNYLECRIKLAMEVYRTKTGNFVSSLQFVHPTNPQSHTGNNIQNLRSGKFVDLTNSSFAPGTPIIIFTLNGALSGTANQQWRMTPVSVCTNLYTIQSVLTGLYTGIDGVTAVVSIRPCIAARCPPRQTFNRASCKPLISSVVSIPWEIIHSGDAFSHHVMYVHSHECLIFFGIPTASRSPTRISSGMRPPMLAAALTLITLANKDGSTGQQWTPRTALAT